MAPKILPVFDPCRASRTMGPRIMSAYIIKTTMSPTVTRPASTPWVPIHRATTTAKPKKM